MLHTFSSTKAVPIGNVIPLQIPVFAVLMLLGSGPLQAQVNSWVKSTSGDWEESQWSLGQLPGAGQDVCITNAGWKAVRIHGPTAQNFAGSLTMKSLTLDGPVDTRNSLLLNGAGLAVPLTVESMKTGTNTEVIIDGSALHLNGPLGVGLQVGGDFTQQTGSRVTGRQVDVGWVGPGNYRLADGVLAVDHVWVGGPRAGTFVQEQGTNASGIVHLEGAASYKLTGGELQSEVYCGLLEAEVHQEGGTIPKGLRLWIGSYHLAGGTVGGTLVIPTTDGWSDRGHSHVHQAGGTNYAQTELGVLGYGEYTFEKGSIQSSRFVVGERGTMIHEGGSCQITGETVIRQGFIDRGIVARGRYDLWSGASLSTGSLGLYGQFIQYGGTNTVAGDITTGYYSHYRLSGGIMSAQNYTNAASWHTGLVITGGRAVIRDTLEVQGTSNSGILLRGLVLSGGELVVSNLFLGPQSTFFKTNGVVTQTGRLRFSGANVFLGQGTHSFRAPELADDAVSLSESRLVLPRGEAVVVRFEEASQVPWSANASLVITGWNGAITGRGQHQVFFGSSTNSLTGVQRSQIYFHDPAGLPEGVYYCRVLGTGEIVPSFTPTGRTPPVLGIARMPDGKMQVTVSGEPDLIYSVDRSFDLSNWSEWVRRTNTSSGFEVIDNDVVTGSNRFYRAWLVP